ncbi:MAG: cytochrome c [Nitrospinota bacterium]|nr:MAG: cytochrome c [Nitrospinota bacterium]
MYRQRILSLCLVVIFALGILAPMVGEAAEGNAEAGKKIYQQFCASCHGASGRGDGPAAAALNPKPRNFTDKELMSQKSDERLFNVIKKGGAANGLSPVMPPWGASLKDSQIWDLIAYIRTLAQ